MFPVCLKLAAAELEVSHLHSETLLILCIYIYICIHSMVALLKVLVPACLRLCMPPVLPAIPLTDIASLTAWANSLDPIYKARLGD